MENLRFVFLIALLCCASASGQVAVSMEKPPAFADLSGEGKKDWVHWGYVSGVQMENRKEGVRSVSSLRKIGTREIHTYENNPTAFRWNDGTPASRVERTESGVFIYGDGFGMEIDAPAVAEERTLRLYCGVWRARGKLDIELTDGSGKTSSFIEPMGNDIANAVAVIRYRSKANGTKLIVRLTNAGGKGNVELQAATLK